MLRAIAYLVTLVAATIWFGTLAIVAALLRVPNRRNGPYDRWGRNWARTILAASGVKVEARGMEKIPSDRPVVYVSNHQSFFDILALAANLPGGVRFVSKMELSRVPVLGSAMRSAGHIFIDRKNRPQAFEAYEEAAGRIRAGANALVFAEGTRSRTGTLQPFKKGPFVLAIAAQVPVVPIYCANTFDILPKGSIRVRPRPVTLYIGDPIVTEGMNYDDRERLRDEAHRVIERFCVGAARVSS